MLRNREQLKTLNELKEVYAMEFIIKIRFYCLVCICNVCVYR